MVFYANVELAFGSKVLKKPRVNTTIESLAKRGLSFEIIRSAVVGLKSWNIDAALRAIPKEKLIQVFNKIDLKRLDYILKCFRSMNKGDLPDYSQRTVHYEERESYKKKAHNMTPLQIVQGYYLRPKNIANIWMGKVAEVLETEQVEKFAAIMSADDIARAFNALEPAQVLMLFRCLRDTTTMQAKRQEIEEILLYGNGSINIKDSSRRNRLIALYHEAVALANAIKPRD